MKIKCCFCETEIGETEIDDIIGNNPWPYFADDESKRCCDSCNYNLVLVARLTHMSVAEAQLRTSFYTHKEN